MTDNHHHHPSSFSSSLGILSGTTHYIPPLSTFIAPMKQRTQVLLQSVRKRLMLRPTERERDSGEREGGTNAQLLIHVTFTLQILTGYTQQYYSSFRLVVRSADYWPTASVCLCSLTDRLEAKR